MRIYKYKDADNIPRLLIIVEGEDTAKKSKSDSSSNIGKELDAGEEKKLLKYADMFNAVTSAAFDAIIMMDNDGNISFWNTAAQKMFGFSKDEVLGKNLHFLLATKQSSKDKKPEFEYFRKGDEGPVVVGTKQELIAKKKNAQEFPIELSLSAVKVHDAWNEIAIIRDISERKKAEEQGILLSEIVESSYDAIIGLDNEGTIISWNTGAGKIYGYNAEEMIGENISILIPPDRKKEEAHIILEKIHSHKRLEHRQTVRISKSGDKKFIDFSLSSLKDSEGNISGAAIIDRDITKEKKMAKTMLSYITVAALRLKNPVETVRDNLIGLLDLVDVLDPTDADIDEIMLQLELQINNSEQIIHNLRELNQAIIGSFEEEVPNSYRTFFSE
jgi:PAS domain S-box-containing protein